MMNDTCYFVAALVALLALSCDDGAREPARRGTVVCDATGQWTSCGDWR